MSYYFACIITNIDYPISRIYVLEVRMNRIHIKGSLAPEELKHRMTTSENIIERTRWQALYLASSRQITASEIADIVGVSVYSINKWVSQYNRNGVESIYSKPRGGRRSSFLTWQEEEKVLEELRDKANKGLLVVIKMVKAEIEQRLQHPVSKDYPYDLLHRHGWRRIVPRPKHPKQDPAIQAEFKKNSRNIWQPPR